MKRSLLTAAAIVLLATTAQAGTTPITLVNSGVWKTKYHEATIQESA